MIKQIDYAEIHSVWSTYLWPNRLDIKHMSSMQYLSGHNIKIYDMYKPYFFAYFIDNNIVGVNSGHKSSDNEFRSRGLYVFEKYRNKGIGKKLLEYAIFLGKSEDCNTCWSIPKKIALSTYLSAGFKQTTDFFKTETSDENCYVVVNINK
jgi:GNAT superfamily N-acetyltransferase